MLHRVEGAVRSVSEAAFVPVAKTVLHPVAFFTSNDAQHLAFVEALARQDSLTGDWYDCSAHLLWIGDRTRDADGAHVEFIRGVDNPVAVKLGPSASPDAVVELCSRLDPERRAGRLMLISRMGAERVEE